MIFIPYLPRLDDHGDDPKRAGRTPTKSSRNSSKIFFKHMFELEFESKNPMVRLPIVVKQTDKLCSTDMTTALQFPIRSKSKYSVCNSYLTFLYSFNLPYIIGKVFMTWNVYYQHMRYKSFLLAFNWKR